MLTDTESDTDEELKMELKSRKFLRIIVLAYITYFMLITIMMILLPIFTRQKFAMIAYAQLPWTK